MHNAKRRVASPNWGWEISAMLCIERRVGRGGAIIVLGDQRAEALGRCVFTSELPWSSAEGPRRPQDSCRCRHVVANKEPKCSRRRDGFPARFTRTREPVGNSWGTAMSAVNAARKQWDSAAQGLATRRPMPHAVPTCALVRASSGVGGKNVDLGTCAHQGWSGEDDDRDVSGRGSGATWSSGARH